MRRIPAPLGGLAPGAAASSAAALAVGAITGTTLVSLVSGAGIPGVPGVAQALIRVFVLLFAIIVHEVAHGLVAERKGDSTARRMGRLTLNPIPHIDLFGSIVIPGFLILTNSPIVFGWAKPVPVDIRRFRDPLRDFATTALAGPASNLCQLAVYVALFHVAGRLDWPNWVGFLAFAGASINLFLAVFNLIPIPPLDGSRLLAAALPPQAAVQFLSVERFGFIIIFGLLYVGALDPIFHVTSRLLAGLLW